MNKVRIGVVGLGIGKRHISEYLKNKKAELVAISDANEKVLKEVSSQYRIKGYKSLEKMLKSEKLNGLSICTPPKSHFPLVKLAAENKVHILCEKPIAPTIAEAKEMIEVCKRNRVKLMIGFKKRFSPTYQFLKRHFAKEFGRPTWILVKFALGKVDSDWFWKEDDGGGPIVENTIHMIDLLRFLVGSVIRVYGEGGTLFLKERYPQIDGAVFTLRFKDKAVATIGAGYASEWNVAKEELAFANKRIVGEVEGPFDNPSTLSYLYRNNKRIYKKKFSNADGFREEIDHFLECIQRDRVPFVTGEDGLEALKISLAVKESIRKERPIQI